MVALLKMILEHFNGRSVLDVTFTQGTIEMLLAGAICGFFYAIFSGQPLTIIGATGPLLVFESIVCYLCEYVT